MSATPSPSLPLSVPDVFISYSQRDRTTAEQVERFLTDNGLKVWRDDRLTEAPATSFISQINEAHAAASRVLVLWSAHSIASRWVLEEAEKAATDRKIVPLALAEFRDLEIPIGFRNLPTLTWAAAQAQPNLLLRALNVADSPNRAQIVPRINDKQLPATYTGQLYGRDTELHDLFEALDNPQIRIAAFDAMGGTGKTALIYQFVQSLKTAGWRGLHSVFIWSFYSQGSSEDKQTHAADFFKAAFAHFHPDGKNAKLPDDLRQQGTELADLIAAQPTLLVLDGLEPLQYAAGDTKGARQYGGIKDPGVKTLLTRLADIGDGHGLTLVTTRIQLHEFEGNASFARHHLDQIPTAAAIELLRDRGIERAAFPRSAFPELPPAIRAEFERAIAGLGNHALSLNLAASLVAEQHGGQIKAFADVLPHLQDDSGIHERHRSPFRVIRALEAGLYRVLHRRLQTMSAEEAVTDSPPANQLALLYFLGLFDRPATLSLLPVVYDATPELREAVIPGDKAEYLTAVQAAAEARDAILDDPQKTDDDHLEARHQFEHSFYELSFAYWLPPVFARFEPKQEGNRSVTNALTQLSNQGLVSKARLAEAEAGHADWEALPPGEWFKHHVDCHPLIREYFGHQLQTHYSAAFQAAHSRLYDHFRFEGLPVEFREPVAYALLGDQVAFPNYGAAKTVKDLISGTMNEVSLANTPPALVKATPDQLRAAANLIDTPAWKTALQRFLPATEAAMTPLFAAIGHGCLAGRHDECFNEVYWPRIVRGDEKFATTKLGLFGQDLATLASFFEKPFHAPSSQLHASRQALVLNLAGFALRAIGRLPDAVEPMRAGMEGSARDEDWEGAAVDAGNLSELLLTLGHLERDAEGQPGALPTAEQAGHFADQSGDLFMRLSYGTIPHANALLATGRLHQAEERFREAEALQRECQPSLPRLYSLPGFLYGDLLLARRRPQEVAERVAYTLPMATRFEVLLDIGLDQLNQARAQALLSQSAIPNPQSAFLKSLLDANTENHIPRGYLAIAECGLLSAEWDEKKIAAALTEAETRARRGPMPLFACDAALLRARLALVQETGGRRQETGDRGREAAKRFRDLAAELIRKHGYGRRVPDLAVLDCELDPCLENFQTACAKVGEEGWWHLMTRLEALAATQPNGFLGTGPRKHWHRLLTPLRQAEQAYHRERDKYLKGQESSGDRGQETGADALLAQLPQEVIQQIADQTGAPADWRQWPEELKAQVVKAIRESQESGS